LKALVLQKLITFLYHKKVKDGNNSRKENTRTIYWLKKQKTPKKCLQGTGLKNKEAEKKI